MEEFVVIDNKLTNEEKETDEIASTHNDEEDSEESEEEIDAEEGMVKLDIQLSTGEDAFCILYCNHCNKEIMLDTAGEKCKYCGSEFSAGVKRTIEIFNKRKNNEEIKLPITLEVDKPKPKTHKEGDLAPSLTSSILGMFWSSEAMPSEESSTPDNLEADSYKATILNFDVEENLRQLWAALQACEDEEKAYFDLKQKIEERNQKASGEPNELGLEEEDDQLESDYEGEDGTVDAALHNFQINKRVVLESIVNILNTRVEDLTKHVDTLKSALTSRNTEIEGMHDEVTKVKMRSNRALAENLEQHTLIDQLRAELAAKDKKIADQQDEITALKEAQEISTMESTKLHGEKLQLEADIARVLDELKEKQNKIEDGYCVALMDYDAKEQNELSFKKNQKIALLTNNPNAQLWYGGLLTESGSFITGHFPSFAVKTK